MKKITIIGAGPAGLGCAHELTHHKKAKKSHKITMYDKNEIVGGLARTHKESGHFFDVGPHRFYTKNDEVLSLWKKTLGEEFIEVPRLTRILYQNKFFNYPVQIKDVVTKLGPVNTIHAFGSYLYSKLFLRNMEPKTFEDWIVKNFGRKLYTVFFKTYTEKVWGIPCDEIGAEWAAQRIKNLNFTEIIKNAVFGSRVRKAKSLVNKFYYPTKGAGYMYETLAEHVEDKGVKIHTSTPVSKIYHKNKEITHIEITKNGKKKKVPIDFLYSSMPLTEFVTSLSPKPPKRIIEAAHKLYYRDHITVNLHINKRDIFPDNWIYVHSPDVLMARAANYNNFLPDDMRQDTTAISVEYFVFQKEPLWKKSDKQLIKLAIEEMEKVDLIDKKDVIDSFVVRETESYPTYYMGHKEYFDAIKDYVDNFKNAYQIGRGGMFKYNNMDHSIYSGMLAARNLLLDKKAYDLWEVNEDAEYLEEKK